MAGGGRGSQFIVPDDLMVPLGAKITQETGQCADSWTNSQLEYYRSMLPVQYQSVPLDALKIQWQNIRKRGKHEGYRTTGHGPSKGWKARKQSTESKQGKLF